MTTKTFATRAISVGLGWIALVGALSFVSEDLKSYLPVVVVNASVALAMAAVLGGVAIGGYEATRARLRTRRHCYPEPARVQDLTEIRQFATEFFGEDVSTVQQMAGWLGKSRRTIFVIRRTPAGTPRSRIVGYFCVLPIPQATADKLLNGTLRGSMLDASHIAANRCRCAYVGGIAAKGDMARGTAVGAMKAEIEGLRRSRKVQVVYTRPITAEGLELAKNFGFRTTGGGPPQMNMLACLQMAHLD